MAIEAGPLNRRILIEENIPTRDTYGAEVESWSTFARVWARKRDVTARELFNAGVTSEATTAFRIRRRDGITTGMRVSYRGALYDIQAILEPQDADKDEALDLVGKALRV